MSPWLQASSFTLPGASSGLRQGLSPELASRPCARLRGRPVQTLLRGRASPRWLHHVLPGAPRGVGAPTVPSASLWLHAPVLWAWSLAVGSQQASSRGGCAARPGLALPPTPALLCSRKLMDKQTFCSSQTTSNTSRYAAALYRQGTRGSGRRGWQLLRGWEAGWGWGWGWGGGLRLSWGWCWGWLRFWFWGWNWSWGLVEGRGPGLRLIHSRHHPPCAHPRGPAPVLALTQPREHQTVALVCLPAAPTTASRACSLLGRHGTRVHEHLLALACAGLACMQESRAPGGPDVLHVLHVPSLGFLIGVGGPLGPVPSHSSFSQRR